MKKPIVGPSRWQTKRRRIAALAILVGLLFWLVMSWLGAYSWLDGLLAGGVIGLLFYSLTIDWMFLLVIREVDHLDDQLSDVSLRVVDAALQVAVAKHLHGIEKDHHGRRLRRPRRVREAHDEALRLLVPFEPDRVKLSSAAVRICSDEERAIEAMARYEAGSRSGLFVDEHGG